MFRNVTIAAVFLGVLWTLIGASAPALAHYGDGNKPPIWEEQLPPARPDPDSGDVWFDCWRCVSLPDIFWWLWR